MPQAYFFAGSSQQTNISYSTSKQLITHTSSEHRVHRTFEATSPTEHISKSNMARGNQRDNAREKAQKALAGKVRSSPMHQPDREMECRS